MHIATVVLSVLLAAEFILAGITSILGTGTARTNVAHLDLSLRLSRCVGIAEIAAAVGLLAGIAVKPLTIMTAAAACLVMAGALGYHPKASTKAPSCFPRRSLESQLSPCCDSPSLRKTMDSCKSR